MSVPLDTMRTPCSGPNASGTSAERRWSSTVIYLPVSRPLPSRADVRQHPRRPRYRNRLLTGREQRGPGLELSPVTSDGPADHDERLAGTRMAVDPCCELAEQRQAARAARRKPSKNQHLEKWS